MSADSANLQELQDNTFGWSIDNLPDRRLSFQEQQEQSFKNSNSIHNRRNKCYGINSPAACLLQSRHVSNYDVLRTPSPRKSAGSVGSRGRVPILVFNSWPSPRLSHCIEQDDDDDDNDDDATYQQKSSDRHLDDRLQGMTCHASSMLQKIRKLRFAYQQLEDSTSELVTEAQHLVSELRDVRNLEILLQLQNGNLKNLSLQKWPFSISAAKSSSTASAINLII